MTGASVSEVAATVRNALAGDEDLAAVYIFGSAARGRAHALSDVDVAVLFDRTLSTEQMFARSLEVGTVLEHVLRRPVDLIVLNRAVPALCFEVLRAGQLVLERDRNSRALFVMQALGRYYDIKPYLDYHRTRLLARIREEGLGRGYRGHRDALAEARELSAKFAPDASRAPGRIPG